MALVTKIIAATGVTAGDDIMQGDKHQTSSRWRRVTRMGFVGSNAVADAACELFYGDRSKAVIYNSTAGASKIPNMQTDIIPVSAGNCPPNTPIRIEAKTPPNTQQGVLVVEIVDAPPRRTGGFRRSGYARRGSYRRTPFRRY